MFKCKNILTLMAMLCVGVVNTTFASELICKTDDGTLHYIPSKESRTIIDASDMNEYGYWFVPVEQVKKMDFTPIPVNEVLGVTEEEYNLFCQGEAGHGGAPWKRFDGVIIPVNEILDLTEDEYAIYSLGEGDHLPDRFIHAGEMYNPKTFGYTPKASMKERAKTYFHYNI
ncbi:MAG: hypothetical protein Q4D21_03105 [Phascolarctobacterium sp.]|nr:hypothetical protein [Phascolarctobacterium sp.]